MKTPATRATSLEPSLTVKLDTKAKAYLAEGRDIISLCAGEPDFETPRAAREAAIEAIQTGRTRYSHPAGLPSLRNRISTTLREDRQLDYAPDQIAVTSGAKHAVFEALLLLIEPGDEVIIPTPYWVTYPELVRFLGGKPVLLPAREENGFVPTAADLDAAMTSHTKAVMLNFPNNPTGAVLSPAGAGELARICVRNDVYIISDEIYSRIVYGTPAYSIARSSPEAAARTLLIDGASKAFAMTGWRMGYLAVPPHLAPFLTALQGQTTHHPSLVAQYGAEAAFEKCLPEVEAMVDRLSQRRDMTLDKLSQIDAIRAFPPQGAFYTFFNVEAFLGGSRKGRRISNSLELCEYLLESHGLALVPGSAFGLEGWMRLSFAASEPMLEAGLERLKRGLESLG